MTFPFGRTVTRIRPPERDKHGDPVEGLPSELSIPDCALAPRSSSEDDDAANTVIVGATLYAPYDADILPADRIRDGDDVYEVEGEPGRWENPLTGDRPGMEVALRRYRG